MTYEEGDARKYFSAVLAGLIVLAFLVATLIYSMVKTEPEDIPMINPTGNSFPTGPPSVPEPTSPPPG